MTAVLASDIVRALEAANRRLKSRAEKSEKVARSLERRVADLDLEITALKSAANLPSNADLPFGLTPSENVIFTLLMARQLVSKESIRSVLYSARPNDEPPPSVIDVFLLKIRKKLGALNFKIETRPHAGLLITPETKTRIRKLLNRGVDHEPHHASTPARSLSSAGTAVHSA